jgi:hypothetical protein
MDIIEICPVCSSLGVKIEPITVKSILKDYLKAEIDEKRMVHFSGNECEITYFSNNKQFSKKDFRVLIWYKEQVSKVPICYCSDLTEEDIFNAVKNGCKTIDNVQEYTNKKITGKCQTENPLGKCCRNVFLKTIAYANEKK